MQQVDWLLRCLNEMSVEKQVNAVNHLLTNVSKKVASNHPQLVEWLRFNYRIEERQRAGGSYAEGAIGWGFKPQPIEDTV
ncbi:MAG: hypothetical protein KME31_01555 [Tolypothrix carrinoi HA7290-LM1]|nr:hypothetical protein [Tolypothrix carrinoi HA7290-LM1]